MRNVIVIILFIFHYFYAKENSSLNATTCTLDHDVGCTQVVSPPEGPVPPDHYDIVGYICNLGTNTETFDVRATVYDTNGWVYLFDVTLTLTDFPAGGDTNLSFGTLWFGGDTIYYTEIYTLLGNDMNPVNDTSAVYTNVVGVEWQYEMDITVATGDNASTGIEFDGTYFYITGANNGIYPNKVYVVDTTGNLVWALDQPGHVTGMGWRNIWWDYASTPPGSIYFLYAMYGGNLEQFGIDPQGGVLTYFGFYPLPPFLPYVSSIVYMPDSEWYFSPTPDSIRKWVWYNILQSAPNPGYSLYDGAYDTDMLDGGWVWWHSQDDPGTGFDCQISQMDALTMNFTGNYFGYSLPTTLTDGIAGGICFYEGFRNHDMLFALIQGTPHDYIVGIPLREHVEVEEEQLNIVSEPFELTAIAPNPVRRVIDFSFSITECTKVSLKVYDITGRLVRTLFDKQGIVGNKTIHWDGRDNNQRIVASGVYLLRLETEDQTVTRNLIYLR